MARNTKVVVVSDDWREAIFQLPKPSKIKPECKRLAIKIIEENAILEMWTLIKKHVVLKQPTRNYCIYIGNLILKIWKLLTGKANEDEDDDADQANDIKRSQLETDVITDLFFNSIMIKKILSEKFYWMIDGLRDDGLRDGKKIRHMLFNCAQPVLWRHLDVPNGIIRFAASMVMLKLYPFEAKDPMMNIEYLEKQHKFMKAMLTDNCVDIRAEATKRVLFHMSLWYVAIPRDFIRDFFSIIVDQLAYDTSIEVRGLHYLLPVAPALNATQHALKLLGNSGINDKSERVRLAAFKLLSALKGHRFLKYYEIVEMEDIIYRLDFEHSDVVKLEIVKLLCKNYCPSKKCDIIDRYRRIRHMVKVSRNAALQFHRIVGQSSISSKQAENLVQMEFAVEHIISLNTQVWQKISSAAANDVTTNRSSMNAPRASQQMANFNVQEQKTINFSLLEENKSIMDCAIVLWTTIRKRLYALDDKEKIARINKQMEKIMKKIFNEYKNTVLMESALVIGSLLSEQNIHECKNLVHKMIENGDLDSDLMSHYIEAYAMWDMNKMIELINHGLKELRRVFEGVSTRSPPKKKTKSTPDKYRRPLEYINMILASANLHTYLVQKFGVHLPDFCKKLMAIKECIPQITFDGPNALNEKLIILVYETYVLISIIISSEKIEIDQENEIDEIIRNPLSKEISWFFINFRLQTPVFSNNFLQAFLRCLLLYVESKPQSLETLRQLVDLLEVLYNYSKRSEENIVIVRTLEETAKATTEALKYAIDGNGDDIIREKLVPLINEINS